MTSPKCRPMKIDVLVKLQRLSITVFENHQKGLIWQCLFSRIELFEFSCQKSASTSAILGHEYWSETILVIFKVLRPFLENLDFIEIGCLVFGWKVWIQWKNRRSLFSRWLSCLSSIGQRSIFKGQKGDWRLIGATERVVDSFSEIQTYRLAASKLLLSTKQSEHRILSKIIWFCIMAILIFLIILTIFDHIVHFDIFWPFLLFWSFWPFSTISIIFLPI